MVGDKLSYPIKTVKLIESQLESYISKMGWVLEDAVAATTGQPLPSSDTILDTVFDSGLITPWVVLMLQKYCTIHYAGQKAFTLSYQGYHV